MGVFVFVLIDFVLVVFFLVGVLFLVSFVMVDFVLVVFFFEGAFVLVDFVFFGVFVDVVSFLEVRRRFDGGLESLTVSSISSSFF